MMASTRGDHRLLPRLPRAIGRNDKILMLRGWRMGFDTIAIAINLHIPEHQVAQALAGIRDGRYTPQKCPGMSAAGQSLNSANQDYVRA